MILSAWCRTLMHTREKEVFFLNALNSFPASSSQEGPFQVTFAVTQHTEEQQGTEHVIAQEF